MRTRLPSPVKRHRTDATIGRYVGNPGVSPLIGTGFDRRTGGHILGRMKLTATPAAEAVVRKVADSGRQELVVVLGTGCCDSTAPFLYDRYYPGPDVVEVGRVIDVPVYARRWLADLYRNSDGLELDVDEGVVNDSFSLESEHDCRFTLRLAATPVTR